MRNVEERVRWKSPGAEIRMMFRFANNAQLDSFPTLPLRHLSTRYSLPIEKKKQRHARRDRFYMVGRSPSYSQVPTILGPVALDRG